MSDTPPLDPGKYTVEALCERIFVRHKDSIRVRKPAVAIANLSNIVQKFLSLTNRKGFHATSLRELAGATGLSMGGLYSYFDSKDTLLLMILGEVDTTMREVLDQAPEDVVGDPLAHLRWVIDAHVRLTEVMQPWFVFAYMEAKAFPPAARKAAIESERLVEDVVEQILRRGQASGRFNDRDPALTASLIKPLLQDWYVKRAKYRKAGISAGQYAERVTSFVRAAIAPR